MKILHLSDLHLGKRVFEMSMLEEQRGMLDWALRLAQEADVTLLAGDIYDRQVPPAEAVALFDDFLTRMHAQGSRVLMISGNHDSAERIAFASGLLGRSGVYVSPVFDGKTHSVRIDDDFGPVNFWLLPFVKPSHVRAALGDEAILSYTEAIEKAIAEMDIASDERNVLIAHQFVTGAARSESEEVSVGGLDNVDADVFSPFDYVALGHLHSAQSMKDGRVRYSGSPLCYAFSECENEKGALMVTMDEKGAVSVDFLPYTPTRKMRRIRGAFDVLSDPTINSPTEDYVQITLTDEGDVPDAASRLRALYPNILQLLYDNARTRAGEADFSGDALGNKQPSAWFGELFEKQNGLAMDAGQIRIMTELIEKIWEGDEA